MTTIPGPSDVPAFAAGGRPPPARSAVPLYARRAWLRLRFGRRVELGARAFVAAGVRLQLAGGARLVLGPGAWLGARTSVHARAELRIGARTLIGPRSVLVANEVVTIGDACVLGDETLVSDTALTLAEARRPGAERTLQGRRVDVGDGARIGPRACLLAGATVGAAARVAPRAVVDGPVAPGAVVDGVPARPQTAARTSSL